MRGYTKKVWYVGMLVARHDIPPDDAIRKAKAKISRLGIVASPFEVQIDHSNMRLRSKYRVWVISSVWRRNSRSGKSLHSRKRKLRLV